MQVRAPVAVAATFALLGCQSASPRVARVLMASHGVVVSNSPMRLEDPAPRQDDGTLVLELPFLVENTGVERAALGLAYISAVTAAGSSAGSCAVAGERVEVLSLAPGDAWRVDCEIRFTAEVVSALHKEDLRAEIFIPLRFEDEEIHIGFVYPLRVEDVS